MLRIVEEIDVGSAGEQIWVEPLNYTSADRRRDQAQRDPGPQEAAGSSGGGKGARAAVAAAPKQAARADRPRRPHGNSLIITATEPDYGGSSSSSSAWTCPRRGRARSTSRRCSTRPARSSRRRSTRSSASAGGSAVATRPARRAHGQARLGHGRRGPRRGRRGRRRGHLRGQHPRDLRRGDQHARDHLLAPRLRAAAHRHRSSSIMPRRQVFIEAVIMDVNVDRTLTLGIGYHGGAPFANARTPKDSAVYGGNNLRTSAITACPAGPRGPRRRRARPHDRRAQRTSSARASPSPPSASSSTPSPRTATPTCSRRRTSSRRTTCRPRSPSARTSPCRPTSAALGALSLGGRAGAARGRPRRPRRARRPQAARRRPGPGGAPGHRHEDQGHAPRQRLGSGPPRAERGDQRGRRAAGHPRRDPHQQAHREHHAHRARSADGGHRRPRARLRHQRRDQDPHPRRHARARPLFKQSAAEDQRRPTCCSSSRPT
jgi:hypothetical protein